LLGVTPQMPISKLVSAQRARFAASKEAL
jgi:hypothetical protein